MSEVGNPTEEELQAQREAGAAEFLRRTVPTTVDGGPEKRDGEQAAPVEAPASDDSPASPAVPSDEEKP